MTALVTIGMIGSSMAQMAIPGEVFAQNPSRFNGRKVTIKNIELVSSTLNGGPNMVSLSPVTGTVSGPVTVGQVGPTSPSVHPCRPPRGFSKVEVFFKGEPEFKGCFFMADVMKSQLDRELGGQNVESIISFRGDYRTGYHISLYKLGL